VRADESAGRFARRIETVVVVATNRVDERTVAADLLRKLARDF
jgi:hypothetical protein